MREVLAPKALLDEIDKIVEKQVMISTMEGLFKVKITILSEILKMRIWITS